MMDAREREGSPKESSVENMIPTMSEEEFFVALKQSVAAHEVLNLTDQVVCTSTTIKLARGESLYIKNGTIVGDCHSIFSMGTDRGYDNGPPALTLEGVTL
jgi:hypothetical protein